MIDLRTQQVADVPVPEMDISYRGEQGPLLSLAIKTAFLTLLTLGIYRFWARTRVRKYFWSSIAPGEDPFEYTGNGLEKLLGFLIAVAVLAIYLGFFQLLLAFAGLSVFSGGESQAEVAIQTLASQATFILVIPLIFYAQYRGRRYILSRTRWRGVRFGAEPAAWGFVWRSMLHWLATILTLGLLLPRQTFWLEKYRVDRTWFGNTRMVQGGRWLMLYPAMKHMFIAAILALSTTGLVYGTSQPVFGVFIFVAGWWFYYGVIYYRVRSFAVLMSHKHLGDDVKFSAELRPSTVFWTQFFGTLLAAICAGLVFTVFTIVAANVLGGMDRIRTVFDPLSEFGLNIGDIFGLSMVGVGYMISLLMFGVFTLFFVTHPILEHYVRNITVLNPDALNDIEQRSRDEMVEAEGFADALDVGAAI